MFSKLLNPKVHFLFVIISFIITFIIYDKFLINEIENDEIESNENDEKFIIKTKGCKIPRLNVMDESIRPYIRYSKQIKCGIPLTKSNGNFLWFNKDIDRNYLEIFYKIKNFDNLRCGYVPFRRVNDIKNEFYDKLYHLPLNRKIKINFEFIGVRCYVNRTKIYEDYYAFFPNNDSTTQNHYDDDDEKYNIVIIGLDSISRMNFERQMIKSYDYIKNKLKAIDLLGYNTVGDNTYPNMIPALSGRNENELADECLNSLPNITNFDNCTFIWDYYSKNNYKTVLGEDLSYAGIFNFLHSGFKRQPTDYYTHPLFNQLEHKIGRNKSLSYFQCLGNRHAVHISFDYIKNFIKIFHRKFPYFMFFWTATISHDYLNTPSGYDDNLKYLLEYLNRNKFLDKTILLLMSDHGMRFGEFRKTYQGAIEEHQPFQMIVLPERFKKNYPIAVNNMKLNQNRLTTNFDLFETLKDLSDTTKLTDSVIKMKMNVNKSKLERGISWFLPIPEIRTCDSIGISSHLCTCNEKQKLDINDIKVMIAVNATVQKINEILEEYPQCTKLELSSIEMAYLLSSNSDLISNTKSNLFYDVTVSFSVNPSQAEFEGTVRMTKENTVKEIIGRISRTNMYGNQSYCVDDYVVKLYCYCKIQEINQK